LWLAGWEPALRRAGLSSTLLLVLFLLLGSPLLAWGCKGHQTVALMAGKRLTPETRQLVDRLLTENPVDPQLKRLCANGSRDLLADASTWPDDIRNDRKNGSWHYIDIPRGAPRAPLSQYCGDQGCVTEAIAEQVAILKDKSADPRKRAEAIRYIVHFVGDLHMPLHASTNNDKGGTCVPVRYFRRRPHESGSSFVPNLHALWDTDIPERDMEGADPAEYANYLSQVFSDEFAKWQAAGIHVEEWAWESHELAETFVYGQLAPPVPVETPVAVRSCTDAGNVGERLMRMHLFAGEAYQESAAPIAEMRLAQAGVRLAMILNEAAGI
jgi:S1/P1 Nuclease